jgi:uncharacterized protein YgiB involved in biofilm formation
MQPGQFLRYRQAFDSFIDCARSARPKAECAQGWADAVQPLLASSPHEMQQAKTMSADYVEMLRADGGRSRYCEAPHATN